MSFIKVIYGKHPELWLLGTTGVEPRLPHKTIPKSLWMSKIAWRPRAGKVRFREGPCEQCCNPSHWTMQHWRSNGKSVYCHTPLRLEYLPPHQEPRERKPCNTSWTWPSLVSLLSFTDTCQWSTEMAQNYRVARARKATKAQDSAVELACAAPAWLGYEVP